MVRQHKLHRGKCRGSFITTRDFEDDHTSKWMAVFTMTVYITIYDIQITVQKVITCRCKVVESEMLSI